MTGNQFVDLVKLMRKAQREYGRTYAMKWMVESKRLEKLVDEEIASWEAAKARFRPVQKDLFTE